MSALDEREGASGGRPAAGTGPAGRRRAGFTLVELVVVLVILALLAATAFTAYAVLIRKANTKALMTSAWSLDHEAMAVAAVTGEAATTTVLAVLNDGGNGFAPVSARTGWTVSPAGFVVVPAADAYTGPWVKGGAEVVRNDKGGYQFTKSGADEVCYLPALVVEEPGIVRVLDSRGCDPANREGPPRPPSPGPTIISDPPPPPTDPPTSSPPPTQPADCATNPMNPGCTQVVYVACNENPPDPPPFLPSPGVQVVYVQDPSAPCPPPDPHKPPLEQKVQVCDVGAIVGWLRGDAGYGEDGWPPGDDALRNAYIDALNVSGQVVAPVSDGNYTRLYDYVYGLTPMVTTQDVRVTNFGWTGSGWRAFQATQGPGTALLVDKLGIPRVRCLCGNPLAKPNSGALAEVVPTVTAQPGDGQVSLWWAPPQSWAAAANRTYRILVDGVPTAPVGHPSGAGGIGGVIPEAETSALITGLSNGVLHTFEVQACADPWCSLIGNAAWSTASASSVGSVQAAPLSPNPSAPAAVSVMRGSSSMSVTWSTVAEAADYYVYVDGEPVAATAFPSATLTGMSDGRTYQVQVAAVSSTGRSARSAPVLATPGGAAASPTDVYAVAGNGEASLSWTAPASWAAATNRVYRVLVDGVPTAPVGHPVGAGAIGGVLAESETMAVVSGLTNGQTYHFQVQACADQWCAAQIGNPAWGQGSASPLSAATTAAPSGTLPASPSGLAAVRGPGGFSASWTAVAGAVGYSVYVDGVRSATVGAFLFGVCGR